MHKFVQNTDSMNMELQKNHKVNKKNIQEIGSLWIPRQMKDMLITWNRIYMHNSSIMYMHYYNYFIQYNVQYEGIIDNCMNYMLKETP